MSGWGGEGLSDIDGEADLRTEPCLPSLRGPHLLYVNDFPPPDSVVKKASSISLSPSLTNNPSPTHPQRTEFLPLNGFQFDGFGKFFLFRVSSRVDNMCVMGCEALSPRGDLRNPLEGGGRGINRHFQPPARSALLIRR